MRVNPVGVLVSQGFAHAADEFGVGADGSRHGRDGQLKLCEGRCLESLSKGGPGASAGFPFPGASQCVVHGRPLAPGGVKPKAASTCLQSSDPTRFLAEMIAQGAARVTGLISETRSGVA